MANSYEQIFNRSNEKQARILILDCTTPFSTKVDFEVCVFKRDNEEEDWERVLDTTERVEKAKNMSVEKFVSNGRNPIFYVVSQAEILKVVDDFMKINYPKDNLIVA